MTNSNKLGMALVVVAIIAIGSYFFPTNKTVVERVAEQIGASSGQNHSFHESFDSALTVGGRFATSSVGSAFPLSASMLENISTLDVTLNIVDATVTFPATSTISYMRNPGDTRVIWVRNATTTAAMDITLASGTGMNFKSASTTKIIVGDTDGGNAARVTLIRQADSDIDMYVEMYMEEQ